MASNAPACFRPVAAFSSQTPFFASRAYVVHQVDFHDPGGYGSGLETLPSVREHLDSAPDAELATP